MAQRGPVQRRIRKIVKWGPWHYRFWRELIRYPYNLAFKTPAVAPDVDTHFPQAAELREKFEVFRTEAMSLVMGHDLPANHEIMPHQRTFYDFDKIPWKMVALRAYSYDYAENLAQMPLMADFLRRNPQVVSAAVSVFPPGKHLRPHKGPFRGVWRYHLPYLVTKLEGGGTSCELTIDGTQYFLDEGQDMLWDDTFMHEARNRSDKPRVVLLLDVYRDDHPWWLGWVSKLVLWVGATAQSLQGTGKRAAVGG